MKISFDNPIPYYSLIFLHLIFYPSCIYLKNPYIILYIIFGILPFLDKYLPFDIDNPSKEKQREMKHMLRFKIPLILSSLLDYVGLYWSINEINKNENGILYNFGIILTMIILQGTAFTTNHELNHKPSLLEKTIGTIGMAKSFYMHFLIEHNHGHHKNVATYDDPASSRYNESIYEFFPRTIIGSYKSAWNLENKFCKEIYNNEFHWKNRMFYFTALIFIIPYFTYLIFGLRGMIVHIIIGFGSIILLETINYIEHYGLQRKKLENGIYENVNVTHSWNAPHRISNYLLFKLQRHSDHHENAMKPYQNLCTYEKSPLMPNGYSTCFLLALFPKLWFGIMNPLVDFYKNGTPLNKEISKELDRKLWKFIFGLNFNWFIIMMFQFYLFH
jgi:alkane 1-monooxygenase